MKCDEINKYIDNCLDEKLETRESHEFEQHILHCKRCAEQLRMAESLQLGLRNLPVERHTVGFRRRVYSEVRMMYGDGKKQAHGYRFAAGFATAAIAGLAIWVVSSVYMPDTPVIQPQIITITMRDTQTVRLVFDSQTDIQQANLSIDLPDNIELDGYPGQRGLTWNTSLKKGPNILVLPVMAVGNGQGELLAHLSYGNRIKEFRVVLKTVLDDA